MGTAIIMAIKVDHGSYLQPLPAVVAQNIAPDATELYLPISTLLYLLSFAFGDHPFPTRPGPLLPSVF